MATPAPTSTDTQVERLVVVGGDPGPWPDSRSSAIQYRWSPDRSDSDPSDGNGAVVASNDDWKSSQQNEIQATGLAPPNGREAAILTTLPTGNFGDRFR
jgi:hypothetical protein